MAEIYLAPGRFALVDDADFPAASRYKWSLHSTKSRHYARSRHRHEGKVRSIMLHHFIVGQTDQPVSFRNGDPLDCRQQNLTIGGSPSKPFQRGALGEAVTIADLTRHGHDVFVPISGHTAADLISISPDQQVIRWQVKLRSPSPNTNAIRVRLGSLQSKKHGVDFKPYSRLSFDAFAVYAIDTNRVYYVPVWAIDWSKQWLTLNLGPRPAIGSALNAADWTIPNFPSQSQAHSMLKSVIYDNQSILCTS